MSADSAKNSEVNAKEVSSKPPATLAEQKFCMDVVANVWSKNHNQPAETYENNYRYWLNKQDASQEELNKAWEEHLVGVDAKDEGRAAAERMMKNVKKEQRCE